MVFLPLVTNNITFIYIHIICIIITIVVRKIFGGCVVRILEKNNKNIETISYNSYLNVLNWDYIFTVVGIFSTTRLYMNTV